MKTKVVAICVIIMMVVLCWGLAHTTSKASAQYIDWPTDFKTPIGTWYAIPPFDTDTPTPTQTSVPTGTTIPTATETVAPVATATATSTPYNPYPGPVSRAGVAWNFYIPWLWGGR